MSLPLDPIPQAAPVIEGQAGTLTGEWFRWLYPLWARVKAAVSVAAVVSKSAQSGSIATTTAYSVTQTGLYRLSYRQRVTTAAGTSSSLTFTAGWREGAVTQSQAGAAMTGNTTTTQQNGTVFLRADSGTTITYAWAYVSVGAPVMAWAGDVVVEVVN